MNLFPRRNFEQTTPGSHKKGQWRKAAIAVAAAALVVGITVYISSSGNHQSLTQSSNRPGGTASSSISSSNGGQSTSTTGNSTSGVPLATPNNPADICSALNQDGFATTLGINDFMQNCTTQNYDVGSPTVDITTDDGDIEISEEYNQNGLSSYWQNPGGPVDSVQVLSQTGYQVAGRNAVITFGPANASVGTHGVIDRGNDDFDVIMFPNTDASSPSLNAVSAVMPMVEAAMRNQQTDPHT